MQKNISFHYLLKILKYRFNSLFLLIDYLIYLFFLFHFEIIHFSVI